MVDSIAALFRAEFGVGQAVQRAQLLQACGAQLHRLSESYGAAVVCVNQVLCTAGVAEPTRLVGLCQPGTVHCRGGGADTASRAVAVVVEDAARPF